MILLWWALAVAQGCSQEPNSWEFLFWRVLRTKSGWYHLLGFEAQPGKGSPLLGRGLKNCLPKFGHVLISFWILLCHVFRCEREKKFNIRWSFPIAKGQEIQTQLLEILADLSNYPDLPQMPLQGCKYQIVQKTSRLSINQSYNTWPWWIPAFHWVSIYTLADAMLSFLGSGYISRNHILNYIRNKGGNGVKNNELLAFGTNHFKHQVCH